MTEKDYFSLIKKDQLDKAIKELQNNKFPEGFLNLIDYASSLIHKFIYKETTEIEEKSSYEKWVYYILTYYGRFDYDDGLTFDEDIKNEKLLHILLTLQRKIKKQRV